MNRVMFTLFLVTFAGNACADTVPRDPVGTAIVIVEIVSVVVLLAGAGLIWRIGKRAKRGRNRRQADGKD